MNELIFKRSIDIINQKDKPAKKELKAYFKYSLEMPKNAQKSTKSAKKYPKKSWKCPKVPSNFAVEVNTYKVSKSPELHWKC